MLFFQHIFMHILYYVLVGGGHFSDFPYRYYYIYIYIIN